MMESAFEQVVIDALDALEAGQDVQTILARYPEYEAELQPILLTTSSLAGMRVAHSLEAQAASRQRFLDYASASASPPAESSLLLLLRRFSIAVAALLIVFALLGTGVLFASAEAVPGDALYDAKRFFEDSRLSLTTDEVAREELQERFEEVRIREVKTLLRMGRSEDVEFSGTIEAIDGDTWLVAGIEVVILDTTAVAGAGETAIGYLVQIRGLTTNGRVNARAVVIRGVGNLPVPAPDTEPATRETPTAEPTPTNTPTPTPTATQTPTATASPEEPGSEMPPTPTSTPTLQSGENGNDNDNDNQNDDNGNEGQPNENEGGGENENGGGNDNDDDDDDDSNENGGNNENHGNDNDDDDDDENDNNANDNRNENEGRSENTP